MSVVQGKVLFGVFPLSSNIRTRSSNEIPFVSFRKQANERKLQPSLLLLSTKDNPLFQLAKARIGRCFFLPIPIQSNHCKSSPLNKRAGAACQKAQVISRWVVNSGRVRLSISGRCCLQDITPMGYDEGRVRPLVSLLSPPSLPLSGTKREEQVTAVVEASHRPL